MRNLDQIALFLSSAIAIAATQYDYGGPRYSAHDDDGGDGKLTVS